MMENVPDYEKKEAWVKLENECAEKNDYTKLKEAEDFNEKVKAICRKNT